MEGVGSRITKWRLQRGLSTNRLAKMAGIGQSTLREIELGIKQPTLPTLSRICSALGLTLAEFFAENGQELSPDLRQLLQEAEKLTPEQRRKLLEFLKSMKGGAD